MALFLPVEEDDSGTSEDMEPGEIRQADQAVIRRGAIVDVESRDPSPGQNLPDRPRWALEATQSVALRTSSLSTLEEEASTSSSP